MVDEPLDEAHARAALQGKRVALGVVIAATVGFIVTTAIHVIPAVFGVSIVPVRAGAPGSAECVAGLRGLELGLEHGDSRSRTDPSDAVHQACILTPEGLQAWASFERLQVAQQQLKERDPEALAQLKRDLSAHLPSDLR
jgi:hypothetical protein